MTFSTSPNIFLPTGSMYAVLQPLLKRLALHNTREMLFLLSQAGQLRRIVGWCSITLLWHDAQDPMHITAPLCVLAHVGVSPCYPSNGLNFVSLTLGHQVLSWAYSSMFSGHTRKLRTMHLLAKYYWWPPRRWNVKDCGGLFHLFSKSIPSFRLPLIFCSNYPFPHSPGISMEFTTDLPVDRDNFGWW